VSDGRNFSEPARPAATAPVLRKSLRFIIFPSGWFPRDYESFGICPAFPFWVRSADDVLQIVAGKFDWRKVRHIFADVNFTTKLF
jgi:hypothetical protein